MTSLIECPATPDRIDQCPATPELLPIKSPASTSTSSDNDENDPTRSTTSPPPNCAICLGKCKNKCFTDSCLHQFCFKCLLEWSKVKAECPLCKQSFKSIIHNVKSIDQFEEYLVQQPIQIENLYPSTRILQYHSHHSTTGPRNNRGFSATVEIHNNNMDLISRAEVLDRFRQRFPQNMVSNGSLAQVWRRYIYESHLYALPLPDVTGRFRECSARFYRENPAQVHRIMPWLNRDLVTLLRNTEQHVSLVLSTIGDLLIIFNISSAVFRRRVTPYFGNNTSHFIHELLNFARSPYDMIGYDRAVQYTQYYEAIIVSTSSDDSDSEVVTISQVAGRIFSRGRSSLGFTIETNERDSTVRIRLANGSNNLDNASSSQTTAINLTTSNNTNNGSNNNSNNNDSMSAGTSSNSTNANINSNSNTFSGQPQVLGETQIIDIEQNSGTAGIGINEFGMTNNVLPINTVSSSSDECEFILEQKPPHLRTPELVSLNSDSDSDVVFISELKNPQQNENGRNKRNLQKGVFLPSSDINHSSDSDIKIEKTQLHNNNDADKIKMAQPSTSNEYNHGASTSSGLKNRSNKNNNVPIPSSSKLRRSRNTHKKVNQLPVRTLLRRRGGRGVKTIFESSSSSDDEDLPKNDSANISSGSEDIISSCNKSDISYWNINKYIKKSNDTQATKRRRRITESFLNMKRILQKKRHSIKRKRNNNDDDDSEYKKDEKRQQDSTKSWKKSNRLQNKQRKKPTTGALKSKTKTVNRSKKRKHNLSSSSSSTSSSSSQFDSSKSTSTSSSTSSSSSSSSDSTDFSDSDMEPLIKIGRYNKKTQTTSVATTNLTNSLSVSSINTNISSTSSNTTSTISATSSNPISTIIPPLLFSNRTNECTSSCPNDEDKSSDEEYNFSLTLDESYNCENQKDDNYDFSFLQEIHSYTVPTNITSALNRTTLDQQQENEQSENNSYL